MIFVKLKLFDVYKLKIRIDTIICYHLFKPSGYRINVNMAISKKAKVNDKSLTG